MQVFKFGGASLKDATGVRNVGAIIQRYADQPLLVVVSAMGKTTDQLEQVVAWHHAGKDYQSILNTIRSYHFQIIDDLFQDSADLTKRLNKIIEQIEQEVAAPGEYDMVYDQIICFGEILSSLIVHQYILSLHVSATWMDARKYIATDNTFREGKVDWAKTAKTIESLRPLLQQQVGITQGFIGSTPEGFTTTLGREGSDFTAAIFGSCLQAKSVTIWKDVPGVMSADPKRLPHAIVFDELPYQEAAEMTYYGASVIHPKTIKPLANRMIPLYVKSFTNIDLPGTIIHHCKVDALPPLTVFKTNQCLISCKVTDFSFVTEQQLTIIFKAISDHDIKINLMQNSAISFSFCVDFRESKVLKLIDVLSKSFEVYYNTGLTLITVKNYDQKSFDEYRHRKGVLLEQSSRSTLQVLVKD